MGSGVLIEVAERLFVATAYHCIKDEPVIVVGGMAFREGHLPPAQVRILNKSGEPDLDIGFLELEQGKRIVTGGEHTACHLSQCLLYPTPIGQIVFVTGWPEHDRVMRPGIMDSTLCVYGADVEAMDDDNLYFEFSKQTLQYDPATRRDEVRERKSPHGYSGGGCWGIVKCPEGELYAAAKTCRLLGIQAGWMKSTRRCRIPLIKHWVRLLARNHRELHEPIMEAMKPLNISD